MRKLMASTLLLTAVLPAFAQQPDTLPLVRIVSVPNTAVVASPVSVQQMDKAVLEQLNSISVADAVKYFPGVIVKDYGGLGGLKTVSIRSLGANHTGVMYDGVILNDAQGGQVDFSKFSLDNIQNISLYNSQPPDILLPARSYASGAIISMVSQKPVYDPQKKFAVSTGIKAGSFGYFNPAVRYQYHFNKKIFSTVSAEWQLADGRYPYASYDNSAVTEKRRNGEVDASRIEYDFGYNVNDSNTISFKAYYYHSARGLPGAIILNGNFTTDQSLEDRNVFLQTNWKKSFSSNSKLLISGKYSYNFTDYIDSNFLNTAGYLQNTFKQREYYVSGAYSKRVSKLINLAFATDYIHSNLVRTDVFSAGFPAPKRNTWLNNLSVQLKSKRLEVLGNLLATILKEEVDAGIAGRNLDALTPAISASWQPFVSKQFFLRSFYKRIFRAPTFNDLYYTFVGNTNLQPEYVDQYDLGIAWKKNNIVFLDMIQLTADAYYNRATNKILAVPRQNLFQWSMLNIGKADIRGLDASLEATFRPIGAVSLHLRGSYSFQKAQDVSDKTSSLYKTQLPYTPEHSGSAHLGADFKNFSVAYNAVFSSYRYRLGEQNSTNLVQGWATQDLSARYSRTTKKIRYSILFEINNIFNRSYEVIKYYPMPGRNFRMGISINM